MNDGVLICGVPKSLIGLVHNDVGQKKKKKKPAVKFYTLLSHWPFLRLDVTTSWDPFFSLVKILTRFCNQADYLTG